MLKAFDESGRTINAIEKVQNLDSVSGIEINKDTFSIDIDSNFQLELDNFKKECVLREISTFEEIINHSLSTLSENENNFEFIKFMEEINEDIRSSLEKHDIKIILPKVEETFDAKEHFVLVAEKDKMFKKGQIIKVVSSGFKENDLVIVKANVVCAI